MSEEITTARKDRRDSVTDEIKRGPTHRRNTWDLMWCGVKIKGIASWNQHGKPEDVDCPRCITAIAQNKPRSWKR